MYVERARPTLDKAPFQKQANVCGAVFLWLVFGKEITARVPARVVVFHGNTQQVILQNCIHKDKT